jgi:hypothetical protein
MPIETLNIGRAKGNTLIIPHQKISSKHCIIKRTSDTDFIIEDLVSANGTFVNGKRIMQTLLKVGDELKLADFEIDTEMIFAIFRLKTITGSLNYEELKKQEAIHQEFIQLKKVYDEYISHKKKIMAGSSITSTGLRAGLSLIPVVGNALGIMASGVTNSVQSKMIELDEKFKSEYVCPVCFRFLGQEPFDNLSRRGSCLYCKSSWKKPLL